MTARADSTSTPATGADGAAMAALDHQIEECARQIQLAALAYELSAARLKVAISLLAHIRADVRILKQSEAHPPHGPDRSRLGG